MHIKVDDPLFVDLFELSQVQNWLVKEMYNKLYEAGHTKKILDDGMAESTLICRATVVEMREHLEEMSRIAATVSKKLNHRAAAQKSKIEKEKEASNKKTGKHLSVVTEDIKAELTKKDGADESKPGNVTEILKQLKQFGATDMDTAVAGAILDDIQKEKDKKKNGK